MSAYEDWKKGKKVDTTSDYEKWKNKDKPKQNPIVSAVSNLGKNIGDAWNNFTKIEPGVSDPELEEFYKKFNEPANPKKNVQVKGATIGPRESTPLEKAIGLSNAQKVIQPIESLGRSLVSGTERTLASVPQLDKTGKEFIRDVVPIEPIKNFFDWASKISGNASDYLNQKASEQDRYVRALPQNELGQNLYNVGQSIPMMGASALAPEAVAPAVFGILAAGQYDREAEEMGASPTQRMAYSYIMGAVEGASEKIPLGNLRKIYGSKKVLLNYFKNMGDEAIQEGLTEIAAGISKVAALKDTSQFMTGGRFDWDKVKNFGKQVLAASGAGAESAALIGLPGTVINTNNIEQFKKSLKEQNPGITTEEINEMVRRVTADNAAAVEAERQNPIDVTNLKPVDHNNVYTASGKRAADVVTNNAPVGGKLGDLINVVNNNQSYKVDDVAKMAQINPESVEKVQTPLGDVKTVPEANEDVLKDVDIENIKPVENEVNQPSESDIITSKMKQIQEDLINEEIENIKSEIGKGVELIPNPQKPDSKIRQSRNPKWYLEFYAAHKRKPNNSELRKMAIERLKNGYENEEAGSIPANEDYIEAERMVNEVNGKEVTATTAEKEILSSKTSTGEVYRQGDKVYKSASWKDGKKTLESEVYQKLSGMEGISEGKTVTVDGKEMIETPHYERVISIDDVKREDRTKNANIVRKNIEVINKAISSLSREGYSYSDPLQFGVKNGKLHLMDFSNVSKNEDATIENFGLLGTFYETFGLPKMRKIIEKAMQLKGNLELYTVEDFKNEETLMDTEEGKEFMSIRNSSDAKPNNIYYTTNERMVQLKGVAQSDMIDGVKYVFSEKHLTESQISEWELKTILTSLENENQPGKHADSGTYAKRQKTDIPEIASETKETRKVKALQMPEIIELVKKINEGKVPKLVARFRNPGVRGQFNAGTGNIKLRQDLFKDTEQAQKTLSHEIGHLVDWLPDKEMGRGNILGRIASLKKYMKHTLGEKPGMSNEGLTAKDRRRLKAAAAELVNQEKIKDANGNEIKPAEVLAIWNDVEGAGRNKDLYNYIAKLDSKQKAQVLRDALKGMVNFNLNKNISDYKDWAKREQVIFQELVRKELKKRQIFDYETINNELKKLTQIWKPFDEAANSQYTKYRHSSPELYADAISVLFNEPTLLQKEAPEFYRGFMNYLESKPAVKRIYDEIQARLNDTDSKIDNRIKTAYEMLEKGHEKRNELNQRRNKSVKSVVDTLMTGLVDKDTGTLRIINKGKNNQNTKGLATRAQYEIEESKYLASEAENYIYELGDKVLKDLKKNGLTVDDVGLYMMLKRVISERSEIANPLGYTKETAQETLDGLKKQLGEEKFAKIESGIENYRNFRDELIINRIEESGMYSPETIQMMRDKKDYAKFSVQHYLDETFGSGTTSKIYKQVGTLNDIENPFVATVLQDISMLRAAKINESKGAVIHLLREMNNTGLEQNIITPAEKVFSPALGKMIAKEPGDPSRGMIQVMYNGKVESFYVPKDIAQTFETNPFEATKIAEIWSKLNRPLKSVLVSKNPFWMVRNIMRDFRATVKNIPEIKIRDTFKLLKFYNQASKEVKEAVFKGKRSEDIQKMMKEFMLNPDRAYSAKNQNYENDIERLADEFELDVYEDKRYHGIQKGYKWFIDKLEKWGKVSEVTSKVAGYKYLVSETSRTPQEIAHIVRTRIGTPDARRVGKWHQVTNNIFMFSNINKEGWRSTIESFKENPASYAWKTIALNVAPKLMLLAAGSGLLRGVLQGAGADDPEKLERIINNIPDYDKKKYNIVPLGLTKLGKSIYLRIPEDYEGQLWGEIMFNLCQGKILGNSGALNTVNESQPYQKNPFLEVGGDLLAYYIMGTNPVDEFSGRPILPEMTYKAGGYEANKRMIGYAWKNLGGSIIYNPSLNVTNDDEEFIEKAMKTPPLNVLGTYLKISDQGKYDEFYDEQEEKGKVQAQNSLKLRNIVVNSVRKLDHIPTIQDARVLYADLKKQGIVNTSYGRFKMQYRNYASYAIGDREMKMVIKAKSRKEREKLMSKFLTQLSSEEYETLKNNLRKLGVKW